MGTNELPAKRTRKSGAESAQSPKQLSKYLKKMIYNGPDVCWKSTAEYADIDDMINNVKRGKY